MIISKHSRQDSGRGLNFPGVTIIMFDGNRMKSYGDMETGFLSKSTWRIFIYNWDTAMPRQNGQHFVGDIFKNIFLISDSDSIMIHS